MSRIVFFIIPALLAVAARPSSHDSSIAGCPRSTVEALARAESSFQSEDRNELIRLLRCMRRPVERYVEDYAYFGRDDIFRLIERNTYKDRLDVIKALVPMMNSRDRIIRGEVAATLGYYKYPSSKQWLAEYPDGPDKAVLYAILHYGRSYRWAIDRLDALDKTANGESPNQLAATMAYLNLLYHLAEPASLPFVRGLIESSAREEVRQRSIQIKDRILLLNPSVKSP